LLQRRTITPREALDLYGSFRLAAVVFELKKEFEPLGMEILTHDKTVAGATFAEYELVQKGAQKDLF
jgi:hypothetical protein